ncbi:hypothetical protein CIHG_08029 [Coccidioides immitis H538.4]|uniref:Uncharacterized protein n=1 Tax=Coccidioides immitis H538.4 TaxID=396776 RepID=A0A0J8S1H4_COCIT|nr:hypothetical protein CIHG_08029 [Coccidioides immitis H538.4]
MSLGAGPQAYYTGREDYSMHDRDSFGGDRNLLLEARLYSPLDHRRVQCLAPGLGDENLHHDPRDRENSAVVHPGSYWWPVPPATVVEEEEVETKSHREPYQ